MTFAANLQTPFCTSQKNRSLDSQKTDELYQQAYQAKNTAMSVFSFQFSVLSSHFSENAAPQAHPQLLTTNY
jgi:hypothetical protein